MKYFIICFKIKEEKQMEIISHVKQEQYFIPYKIFYRVFTVKRLVSQLGMGTHAPNPST